MNAIQAMIEFVNSGKETELISEIETVCSDSEDVTARIVCIMILDWIRRQYGKTAIQPLRLGSYPWATCLRQCISECRQLRDFFRVNDGELNFQEQLDIATLNQTVLAVHEGYQPILFKN